MNTWVLVLILLSSSGNAITTQKFENKQLCEFAGEEAKKLPTMAIIKYTCVPAGRT
jgi:hypothetical protein